MALYVLSDTHLSLSTNKSMTVFRGWDDYVERLEKQWRALVEPQDTVVIAGDVSWAMTLEETTEDFAFLQSLPGRKLLFKGNHDYWWCTRRKMDAFLEQHGFDTLTFVHNDAEPDNEKILRREAGRLRMSLEAAVKTGLEPIVFLHYPPLFDGRECEELLAVLREFPVRRCYYGHVHGAGIRQAFQGEWQGIAFRLTSCDALTFCPLRISE